MTEGASLEEAQAAKAKVADTFRPLVGEVAVGIVPLGSQRYALKVNLETPAAEGVKLPKQIDGVPVRVEVVGKIRKR